MVTHGDTKNADFWESLLVVKYLCYHLRNNYIYLNVYILIYGLISVTQIFYFYFRFCTQLLNFGQKMSIFEKNVRESKKSWKKVVLTDFVTNAFLSKKFWHHKFFLKFSIQEIWRWNFFCHHFRVTKRFQKGSSVDSKLFLHAYKYTILQLFFINC